MDSELTGADDYLTRAAGAMAEVNAALDAAAGVFVEDATAREQLGDSLGRARNAMGRAIADVTAHRARAGRESEGARARAFFLQLPYAIDDRAQLAVATSPLPLEPERFDEALFRTKEFHDSFNHRVNNFNARHRGMKADFLIIVPGSSSSREREGHFEFVVWGDGGGDPMQMARLYSSGLFVLTRALYCYQTPKWVHSDFIVETVLLSLAFAGELYEDFGIDARAVGVQAALLNANEFELRSYHQRSEARAIGQKLLVPPEPLVLSLPLTDTGRRRIVRAVSAAAGDENRDL